MSADAGPNEVVTKPAATNRQGMLQRSPDGTRGHPESQTVGHFYQARRSQFRRPKQIRLLQSSRFHHLCRFISWEIEKLDERFDAFFLTAARKPLGSC